MKIHCELKSWYQLKNSGSPSKPAAAPTTKCESVSLV